jgi:hypothetical protein
MSKNSDFSWKPQGSAGLNALPPIEEKGYFAFPNYSESFADERLMDKVQSLYLDQELDLIISSAVPSSPEALAAEMSLLKDAVLQHKKGSLPRQWCPMVVRWCQSSKGQEGPSSTDCLQATLRFIHSTLSEVSKDDPETFRVPWKAEGLDSLVTELRALSDEGTDGASVALLAVTTRLTR